MLCEVSDMIPIALVMGKLSQFPVGDSGPIPFESLSHWAASQRADKCNLFAYLGAATQVLSQPLVSISVAEILIGHEWSSLWGVGTTCLPKGLSLKLPWWWWSSNSLTRAVWTKGETAFSESCSPFAQLESFKFSEAKVGIREPAAAPAASQFRLGSNVTAANPLTFPIENVKLR